MRFLVICIAIFLFIGCTKPQDRMLSKLEIEQDLERVLSIINEKSSYQGLNGYDCQAAIKEYQENLPEKVSAQEFQASLVNIIGGLGDRHARIKFEERIEMTLFLPFITAPYKGKILALTYADDKKRSLKPLYNDYPYLVSMDGISILELETLINRSHQFAPPDARLYRFAKQLKYLKQNYQFFMKKPVPEKIEFVFSDGDRQKKVMLALSKSRSEFRTWRDQFPSQWDLRKDDLNNSERLSKQFRKLDGNIGYIRFSKMFKRKQAESFFDMLTKKMQEFKGSSALIIDIRNNSGGVRDLIFELAGYLVDENETHIVNVARRRTSNPNSKSSSMTRRYLYHYDQLDKKEQQAVDIFMQNFKPQYLLPNDKFSPYHYALFNGKKLRKIHHYIYKKPVYIMTNESSFSAASVMAATLKGLPNVKLVGITADGSSGNSKEVILDNSELILKVSTMVSYQKDGKVFDTNGITPDIPIERDLEQILWKKDYQLEKLIEIIKSKIVKS